MNFRLIAVLLFSFALVSYGQLKDPQFRDEDISGTEVQTIVNRLENGLYEYIYNIQFPEENKGSVLTIGIDISCDADFGAVDFSDLQDSRVRNLSPDGEHVPIRIDDVEHVDESITVRNYVTWGVFADPGNPPLTLKVVSPAPPGERRYEITPAMDTTGWDYPELEEYPEIPWIDDFKVTGIIEGPACNTSAAEPLFAGNQRGFENEAANELLTYRKPTQNRWHAESDKELATFVIVYSDRIDPKSFKVTPGWARKYFHPEPGTEETVELPLKPGINKLTFQARVPKSPGPRGEEEVHHSESDRDDFEIRVPPRGRGQARR